MKPTRKDHTETRDQESWEKEFDKKFTCPDFSHHMCEMFTSDELIVFIRQLLLQSTQHAREEERERIKGKVKLMGYVDSEGDVQMLDLKHIKEIVKMVLQEKGKK